MTLEDYFENDGSELTQTVSTAETYYAYCYAEIGFIYPTTDSLENLLLFIPRKK